MFSEANDKTFRERESRYRALLLPPEQLMGPDRISIHAIFGDEMEQNFAANFSPRELVPSADVILGVNVSDGHEFLVYGRERLERIAKSGQDEPLRVLRIELDQETDELEKLIALVRILRGSHNYPGGVK